MKTMYCNSKPAIVRDGVDGAVQDAVKKCGRPGLGTKVCLHTGTDASGRDFCVTKGRSGRHGVLFYTVPPTGTWAKWAELQH